MTTMAKSNAIFWNGIVLHVIYVMDFVSILFAYCTSVIIALSDHLLKLSIPCFWIGFGNILPVRTFLSYQKGIAAFRRTERVSVSVGTRKLIFILLPAICANKANAAQPDFVMAFLRAKLSRCVSWMNKKFLTTISAFYRFLAALPRRGFATGYFHAMFGMSTIVGAITRSRKTRESLIGFSAVFANLCYLAVLRFRSFRAAGIRTIRGSFGTVWMNLEYLAAEFASYVNHVFHNMDYTIKNLVHGGTVWRQIRVNASPSG